MDARDLSAPERGLPVGGDRPTGRVPWGTTGLAVAVSGGFLAQLLLAPAGCPADVPTGHCAAAAFVRGWPVAGVLALPFLHASATHFGANLLAIVVLGVAVERYGRAPSLLALVLATAYLSVYADIAIGVATGDGGLVMGMSGATRALGAFVLVTSIGTGPLRSGAITWLRTGGPPLAVLSPLVVLVAGWATAVSMGQAIGVLPAAPTTAVVSHAVGSGVGAVAGAWTLVGGRVVGPTTRRRGGRGG